MRFKKFEYCYLSMCVCRTETKSSSRSSKQKRVATLMQQMLSPQLKKVGPVRNHADMTLMSFLLESIFF